MNPIEKAATPDVHRSPSLSQSVLSTIPRTRRL
jgi:hypothetical protein